MPYNDKQNVLKHDTAGKVQAHVEGIALEPVHLCATHSAASCRSSDALCVASKHYQADCTMHVNNTYLPSREAATVLNAFSLYK